jgi:sulfatase maturation enzyme AslB (radical SAM superfamily)
VPAFNSEAFICDCLRSCLAQDIDDGNFEVILIDDCSTDRTYRVALDMAGALVPLRVARTDANGGPGVARNVGIALARGEWILFVDSDDLLDISALRLLSDAIDRPENMGCDVVGFNWTYADSADRAGMRRDHAFLACEKPALISRYLSLQMDGSVVFTAMRRCLLDVHCIRFAAGYHEDVDFLFQVYWYALRIGFMDEILYVKWPRSGSIVETISVGHINGFMRAWQAIGHFLERATGGDWESRRPAYQIGLVGIVATRVREAHRCAEGFVEKGAIYQALHDGWLATLVIAGTLDLEAQDTAYFKVTRHFLAEMGKSGLRAATDIVPFDAAVTEIMAKSWSCVDLHHSVFLAPSEVRTCCKRFFVDGAMRGDVVLMRATGGRDLGSAPILAAKEALHRAVNRGEETACTGCPFLEFKAWGPIAPASIRYLSLEYHSVCNLKCTYCDETYYGGLKPAYDVRALVDDFIVKRTLDPRAVVVWGGGEPVIDRNFTPIADMVATDLPEATQRVLTNGVTYSATVKRLLKADRISITTSVDAGTGGVFAKVRGRDRLARVVGNLKKYSAGNPAAVTIKYIFTEGNTALDECRAFVAMMEDAALMGCNFQISHDFKRESVDGGVLVSIIALYAFLVAAGCRLVFFDDLLRQRLAGLQAGTARAVRAELASIGVANVLMNEEDYPDLVIWGAGWQAKYCLEHANFFKRRKPAFLVDSTPSKIGSDFMGYRVHDPVALVTCACPVLIAAAQGYPAIYEAFVGLGLPLSRLVTKVVI